MTSFDQLELGIAKKNGLLPVDLPTRKGAIARLKPVTPTLFLSTRPKKGQHKIDIFRKAEPKACCILAADNDGRKERLAECFWKKFSQFSKAELLTIGLGKLLKFKDTKDPSELGCTSSSRQKQSDMVG